MQKQMSNTVTNKIFHIPPPTATLKIQTQHVMNCQYQILQQKQNQNSGYRLLPEDIDTDTDFIPFQDHTRYITETSTCSQSASNTKEPYTSKHFTVPSTELHEQSITILEVE